MVFVDLGFVLAFQHGNLQVTSRHELLPPRLESLGKGRVLRTWIHVRNHKRTYSGAELKDDGLEGKCRGS